MRFIALLALLSFSSISHAVDYYWSTTTGTPVFTGASPLEACQKMYDYQTASPNKADASIHPFAPRKDSETRYTCLFGWRNSSNTGYLNTRTVSRLGDSCPPDYVYNSETGTCDGPPPDECKEKIGQEEAIYKAGRGPDAFMTFRSTDGMFYVTTEQGCFSGCRVALTDTKCKANTLGDYRCWTTGTYDGEKCPTGGGEDGGDGSNPEFTQPDSEFTEPSSDKEQKPCIYIVNADGSKSCISQETIEQEGHSCGLVNGVPVCSGPSQPPTKEDLKIETTVTDKTNPDGSTTTTKTDKADYTTCVGTGCKTSTTTSTTTTTKDANGNTTGSTGTCTGPLCADKGGNPDANGDGLGDCVVNCSDEDGGTFEGPENEEVGGFEASAQEFMTRAKASPIMQSLSAVTFPTGGSCGFGSASTKILGTLSFETVCQNSGWLDPLYPVFLAVWCFAAIREFFKA